MANALARRAATHGRACPFVVEAVIDRAAVDGAVLDKCDRALITSVHAGIPLIRFAGSLLPHRTRQRPRTRPRR